MKAFSKSFGSSEALTSFAMSLKRAWRSASVIFCDFLCFFAFDFGHHFIAIPVGSLSLSFLGKSRIYIRDLGPNLRTVGKSPFCAVRSRMDKANGLVQCHVRLASAYRPRPHPIRLSIHNAASQYPMSQSVSILLRACVRDQLAQNAPVACQWRFAEPL